LYLPAGLAWIARSKFAAAGLQRPDITAFGRYSYQNGVPFLDKNFGTFGIHLTYDLFDAGKRRALVRERRAEVSEAEENLERTKEEVGSVSRRFTTSSKQHVPWLRSLEKMLPRGRRMPGSLKSNSSEAFC
jgi:hypothetical protein